jgi:hypothetical protein
VIGCAHDQATGGRFRPWRSAELRAGSAGVVDCSPARQPGARKDAAQLLSIGPGVITAKLRRLRRRDGLRSIICHDGSVPGTVETLNETVDAELALSSSNLRPLR